MKNNLLMVAFSLFVLILSGCNHEISKNGEDSNKELYTNQEIFYADEYYSVIVTNQFKDNEGPNLNNFIIKVQSMEELEEYNSNVRSHIEKKGLNLNEYTFNDQNVWYLRIYGDKEKLPIMILTELIDVGDRTATLNLQQIGFNEFNFEQDNLYCYNEFIFTTNKNINSIEIKYVK